MIRSVHTGLGDATHMFSATGHVNAPLAMVDPATIDSIASHLQTTEGSFLLPRDPHAGETLKFRPDLTPGLSGALPLKKLIMYAGGGIVGLFILYKLFAGKGGHSSTLPVKENPGKRRRKNPERVPQSERLRRAVSSYESFHWGDAPKRIVERKVSKVPRVGVKLGKLVSVAYETHKNGEHAIWEHEFGEEGGKRPDLVMDADTDRLHIVGGSYKVRPEGIVD